MPTPVICYGDLGMLWNFLCSIYLVVIIKSITNYLSFRFLWKYFACFKPLRKCLRWWWRQFYLNKSFFRVKVREPSWSQVRVSSDMRCFSLSFSFFFFYYYYYYYYYYFCHSDHKNNCLGRKDESFFNNRGQNMVTAYDRDINKTNKTRHKDKWTSLKWNSKC